MSLSHPSALTYQPIPTKPVPNFTADWQDYCSYTCDLMEDTLKESPFNLADPENYYLRCKKKVRWSDQDGTAHVNNVQFARFIETSRIVFLHGIASNVRDLTTFFMIARVEIDYLAEMRVPGKVRASTQIGPTSVAFGHGILKGGHFTAVGQSVVVHIDRNQRRLSPINKGLHQDLLK